MKKTDKYTVSVSLGSVLDTEKLGWIYYNQGAEKFREKLSEIVSENGVFAPGPSLGLVKKLSEIPEISLVLVSKVSADSHLMEVIFSSINKYFSDGLNAFEQTVFSSIADPIKVHKDLGVDLSITTNPKTLKTMVEGGVNCVRIPYISREKNIEMYNSSKEHLSLILDFDAVLGDSYGEEVYQEALKKGDTCPISAFMEYESSKKDIPCEKGVLTDLISIISKHIEKNPNSGINLDLVTARNGSVFQRVILTLKKYDINVDQFWFMAGYNKNIALDNIVQSRNGKKAAFYFLDDGVTHYERVIEKNLANSSSFEYLIAGAVGTEANHRIIGLEPESYQFDYSSNSNDGASISSVLSKHTNSNKQKRTI